MQPSPRAQALAQAPVVTTYVASTSMNMNIDLSAAQPKPPTIDAAPSARSEPTPRPKRNLVPAPEPPARRHWKLIDATVRGDVRRMGVGSLMVNEVCLKQPGIRRVKSPLREAEPFWNAVSTHVNEQTWILHKPSFPTSQPPRASTCK